MQSQFTYCYQLWRPYHIKEITIPERVQRRATKYILNDLSYILQIQVNSTVNTSSNVPIQSKWPTVLREILWKLTSPFWHTQICNNKFKFINKIIIIKQAVPSYFNNSSHHFYFCTLPKLWNSLPLINLNLFLPAIKKQLTQFLWNYFLDAFDTNDTCMHFS